MTRFHLLTLALLAGLAPAVQAATPINETRPLDPRGMVEFLQILRARQGRDPGSVQTFFASHPAPAERVARLQREANRLAGGRRDSAQFQQVQSRLNRVR